MTERTMFQEGMLKLATAFGAKLTSERTSIYWDIVGSKLATAQWEHAVQRSLEAETFFPAPAVLLRYGRADGSLAARAGEALEKILSHFERGESLSYRDVQSLYGRAAADAFMAAGGAGRFQWCEEESRPFRLKDFTAAFLEVAEVDPMAVLGPAREQDQLGD